jgi:hypothetical protein
LRAEVEEQLDRLVARRGMAPRAVRVAFFDDDGPRGGVAIRSALTLTPSRGPILNPENFFAQIEQAGFSPGNTVPGIGPSPDKMLLGRMPAPRRSRPKAWASAEG